MNTCVTFTSDLFMPFLPEDSQVNPNCYGAELCWWLSRELARKNIVTSYPNAEDWGWFLEFIEKGNEFWICCGNIAGENTTWQIYIRGLAKGIFMWKYKPPMAIAKPVLKAIDLVLKETAGIHDIEWRKEV